MTTAALRKLGAQIAELRDGTHVRTSQLAFQTIEDGAITVTDATDGLTGSLGMQFDGSTTAAEFNGPPPLTPTAPLLSSSPGSLVVGWDGLWVDGDVVPMNFTRVEVHVSATANFDSSTAATLKGTFETPRGGEISLAMIPGTVHVQLVARNLSGARSPASDEMTVDVAPAGVQNTAGETVGGFSPTGTLSSVGASVEATDFDADGNPIGGLDVYGKEFLTYLEEIDGSTVAQVYYPFTYTSPEIKGEVGICELAFEPKAGASYLIHFNGLNWGWIGASTSAVFALRYTTDGSAPTIANTTIWDAVAEEPPAAAMPRVVTGGKMTIQGAWNLPPGSTVRILLTVRAGYGPGNIKWCVDQAGTSQPRHHLRWIVQRSGLDVAETYQGNGGGGTYPQPYGTTDPAPAPPPAPVAVKKNYVKTVGANDWFTYRSTNTLLRGRKSSPGDTSGYIYQGYSSSGSFNGDQRGLWTFPSMSSDLSGATLTKLEFYIYFQHWYNSVGGTALIRFHNYAAGGAPTGSVPALTGLITQTKWANPGGLWINVPAAYLDDFKANRLKGVAIGPVGSTSPTYYGYARATAQMRYSFTK